MANSITDWSHDGLAVRVERVDDDLAVQAKGELYMASAGGLERDLLDAFEGDAASIVLDLESVTFIDSSGLRLLVWAAHCSREDGDRLRIQCGTGAVRRMLELTELDRSLPLDT